MISREEFEVWAKTRLLDLSKDHLSGAYLADHTAIAWLSWKASKGGK